MVRSVPLLSVDSMAFRVNECQKNVFRIIACWRQAPSSICWRYFRWSRPPLNFSPVNAHHSQFTVHSLKHTEPVRIDMGEWRLFWIHLNAPPKDRECHFEFGVSDIFYLRRNSDSAVVNENVCTGATSAFAGMFSTLREITNVKRNQRLAGFVKLHTKTRCAMMMTTTTATTNGESVWVHVRTQSSSNRETWNK